MNKPFFDREAAKLPPLYEHSIRRVSILVRFRSKHPGRPINRVSAKPLEPSPKIEVLDKQRGLLCEAEYIKSHPGHYSCYVITKNGFGYLTPAYEVRDFEFIRTVRD